MIFEHDKVVDLIKNEISRYINDNGFPHEIFFGNTALNITDSPDILFPDIMVINRDSDIRANVVYSAPEMIVEVVSSESRKCDYTVKLDFYMNIGISEFWIVDLADDLVIVYLKDTGYTPKHYLYPGAVPVSIFGGEISIDFSF